MSWRVVIRPEVETDVTEAARWYEAREAGLGAEFVEEIIKVWDELAKNPLLHARRHPQKISAGVILNGFLTASFTKFWNLNTWSSSPPFCTPPATTDIGNAAFVSNNFLSPTAVCPFNFPPCRTNTS